ncbi:MAG: hypothetical protein ACK2UI_14890, partial [Anaerolineae bacterium]
SMTASREHQGAFVSDLPTDLSGIEPMGCVPASDPDAGYTPDAATPILADPGGSQFKDPAWDVLGARVTQTNEADLKMSGEFRRY